MGDELPSNGWKWKWAMGLLNFGVLGMTVAVWFGGAFACMRMRDQPLWRKHEDRHEPFLGWWPL